MMHDYSGLPIKFLKNIATQKQYWMFDGIIDTIVDSMQAEIVDQKYHWRKIWYTQKMEGNKMRMIGIQDIKQQLYDYVAVNGLAELFEKKIGYYQCAAIPGKGQEFGKKAIKRWLRSSKARCGWKGDAKKYYENIDTSILKKLLKRYVKNERLLDLTFVLIDSFNKGLSIGSYLSQYLANFYMSFAYHYVSGLSKIRKSKRGSKRTRLIQNIIIYMDDILIIGPNLKYLKMAVKNLREWIKESLNIILKPEEIWINFESGYADIMGFLISRKKTIVRPRIFRRYRRSVIKAFKTKSMDLKSAQQILSRWGWFKNADTKHFLKRIKANLINKLSKEVISRGKNVVYFTAGKSKNCCFA